MNEEIKAVADRLIGLREIMDVSVEEAAGVCGISIDQYKKYETGTVDIPVGILQSMSKKYGTKDPNSERNILRLILIYTPIG